KSLRDQRSPMNVTKPDLTVVVPTFNEERFIARQILALRQYTEKLTVQIVVVDNGSQDRTVALATQAGADIILHEEGTVGAIRNAGAKEACASVLAFMDADVFPTAIWADRIRGVIDQLNVNERILTGSWVSV